MREAKPRRVGTRWMIRLTDEYGRRRKRFFDAYADALKAQIAEQARVAEVKDGTRPREPLDHTFDELADNWIEFKVPQKRSGHHDLSIIRHHLRPSFGAKRLRDINVEDIDRFKNERTQLSEKTLANILTLLISMLRRATEDLRWLRVMPKVKKPKVEVADEDFNYLRNDDEIRRFLDAAQAEGMFVYVLFATAIYTGMRAGELAGLHWSNVRFPQRLITVKFSYDGPTKTGKNRQVPILDPLLPLLKQRRLMSPGDLVFQNQHGGMLRESAWVFQEVLHAAGFPRVERHGRTRRYIVFHDLRHSFASHWMMNGGDIFRLKKILGHKTMAMTDRYSHLAPEAFASDYGRLGKSIPVAGEVVPMAVPQVVETAPGRAEG
jgi:integrase